MLGMLVVASGGLAVAAMRSRGRRRLMVITAIVATVASALFLTRLLGQGISDGVPPRGDATIRAISWNAGDLGPAEIADALGGLIDEGENTAVVLPETGWKSGEIVASELERKGYRNEVFAPDWTATSVLLPEALASTGGYRTDPHSPPWAGLALVPERPSFSTPIIVATHLQRPQPDSVATWRQHVEWVRSLCASSPYVIVIGDMNATLNNLGSDSLGGCVDVAGAHGAGASVTWPTGVLGAAGVSIDRFMVGAAFDPARATFLVLRDRVFGGSDHWPISVSF